MGTAVKDLLDWNEANMGDVKQLVGANIKEVNQMYISVLLNTE